MPKYKTYSTPGNSILTPGTTKAVCYDQDNPSNKTVAYAHGQTEADKDRAMNSARQQMADRKLSES